jgi:hypothetical protein
LLDQILDLIAVFFHRRGLFGSLGQVEYLKEGPVKGDQIFPDQAVSGSDVFIEAELEQAADGVIGIIGQTVAVRDETKEKVQKQFFLAETGQKTIANEAVGDKAETTLDASQSIGVKNLFGDHGRASFFKRFTA